jgi:hypothetical protein
MRRDGRVETHISEKRKINIFAEGLDDPNHVEPPCKIRFYVHAILAAGEPRGRAGVDKIELILPDEAEQVFD